MRFGLESRLLRPTRLDGALRPPFFVVRLSGRPLTTRISAHSCRVILSTDTGLAVQ